VQKMVSLNARECGGVEAPTWGARHGRHPKLELQSEKLACAVLCTPASQKTAAHRSGKADSRPISTRAGPAQNPQLPGGGLRRAV